MFEAKFRKKSGFLGGAVVAMAAAATPIHAAAIGDVFVIAMENHNWTQPNGNVGGLTSIQQIFNNPNAPFINSIVNPNFNGGALTPTATLAGTSTPIQISTQTAYANNYLNVLFHPVGGSGPSIHPSEPNYLWSEGGTNYGVLNDNQPYGTGGTNQNTTDHLSTLLTNKGISWKSYQEDIDTDAAGNVLPQNQWTSPITNRSGTYTTVANPYNGSKQFDYAVKHNPMAFFTDTNGGNDSTPSNPAAAFYAPLQQLQTDLNNNTVARYNWITPNQFNDQHTSLTGGYSPKDGSAHVTGDAANIRQGDDFLSQIVPTIMGSQAYKNNGTIVIWNDETEPQTGGTDPGQNDTSHTSMEIVISPLAHPNVGGLPFASNVVFTHSSDLLTMQEIFQAPTSSTANGALGDASTAGTNDLSDLFAANTIPSSVPEPSSMALLGVAGMTILRRKRN